MVRKKIIITGAQGFIGKHLVKKMLRSKFDIEVLEKNDYKKTSVMRKKISGSTIIIHLAGSNRGGSLELLNTNLVLTIKLLRAIKKSDVNECVIIFASSFGVYKQNSKNLLTEQSLTFPRNSYGLSKLICEKIIIAYCFLFGSKYIIFRISNVYGPGSKINYSSVVANFINATYKNEQIIINGGHQIRDFIYIDDVVDAFLKAANLDVLDSKVFNICSGKETSIKTLAQTIRNISKKDTHITYKKNDSLDEKFVGSFEKVQKALDWKPKINLHEGISKTYSSWQVQ